MIFDTHAHYDDIKFDNDRFELLTSMHSKNVAKIVNVSAEYSAIAANKLLTTQFDFIYGTIGLHPDGVMVLETSDNPDRLLNEMKSILLNDDKMVAVGEIGLDYFYEDPERTIQKKWFEAQMNLAKEVKKPVIIHSRDACEDTIDILKAYPDVTGVMHCFSYSKEVAKTLVDMGYLIGVGGVVTFKNSKKLKETVEYLPLDKIILETDCPYMAPEPYRGTRNDSSLIKYVIDEIASIKGLSPLEVEDKCYENACKFYKINN